MTQYRCDPYVYRAAFRRVGNGAMSQSTAWGDFQYSDPIFSRDRIGVPGGPDSADIVFSSRAICPRSPTQCSVDVHLESPQWAAQDYSGNALAAGTVTIDAFSHSPSNLGQTADGFFLRMTTTLEQYALDAQPHSSGPMQGGITPVIPLAWSTGRRLLFDLPEEADYEDQAILYDSLPQPSVFANGTTGERADWGAIPCFGFSYVFPLYTFEFGSLISGQRTVVQTLTSRLLTNALPLRAVRLVLGVHSRSAYASIHFSSPGASDTPYPDLSFSPIEHASSLAEDAESRDKLDGYQKAPARFRVATAGNGAIMRMPYVKQGLTQTFAQAVGLALPHEVSPGEGRDVDTIQATVATPPASSRTPEGRLEDFVAHGSPLSKAAAGQLKYTSVWPANQPQTDVALAIGTAMQTRGASAQIRLSLTANQAAAANSRMLREITYSQDTSINYDFRMPWFMRRSADLADGDRNILGGPGYSLIPAYVVGAGSSTSIPAISLRQGFSIGQFGDFTLDMSQTDHSGNVTIAEWRAHETTNKELSRTLTQESEEWQCSVVVDSLPLWREYKDANPQFDDIDILAISRANNGVPPGYETRWSQMKSELRSSSVDRMDQWFARTRLFSSCTETSILRSLDAIGWFETYAGWTNPLSGYGWAVSPCIAPRMSVEQRLSFSSAARLRVPVSGPAVLASQTSVPEIGDTQSRQMNPYFAVQVSANIETRRQMSIYKPTYTVSDDEVLRGGDGSNGSGTNLASYLTALFGNAGTATFSPFVRVHLVSFTAISHAQFLQTVSTSSHARVSGTPGQTGQMLFRMDEQSGALTLDADISAEMAAFDLASPTAAFV